MNATPFMSKSLKKFKDRGQTQSYEELDIECHDYQGRWIEKFWWNYGYNKEKVFCWTWRFLVVFTLSLITFLCKKLNLNYLNQKVYNIPTIPIVSDFHWRSRLWYSLVYTITIFFSLSLKPDKIQYKAGIIYLFFVHICGIVCLAYMANFVLQR